MGPCHFCPSHYIN